MLDDYYTFRSVTAAQGAAHALERAGITSAVQRTPRSMQQQGCGYSVRVHSEDRERALELFRRDGIYYSKLYRRESGGGWTEVPL